MLDGDLTLMAAPPDLSNVRDRALAELSLRAAAIHDPDGEVTTYRGKVQGTLGHIELRCDRLTHVKPGILIGTGTATLRGLAGFAGPIQADRWTYSADADSFT